VRLADVYALLIGGDRRSSLDVVAGFIGDGAHQSDACAGHEVRSL
jgi:hypothetical protein